MTKSNENDKNNVSVSMFEIPTQVLKNAELAKQRIAHLASSKPTELTQAEARFLTLLIEFALVCQPDLKTATFSYHEFQTHCQRHNALAKKATAKVPVHRSSIHRRVRSLTDSGLFIANELELTNGGRAPSRYTLKNIYESDFHTNAYEDLLSVVQGHEFKVNQHVKTLAKKLREGNAHLVEDISQVRSKTETMFTGIFDRAMRFSTKEVIKGNEIIVRISVKKADLVIRATAYDQLAALSDQRVIRAIMSHIAHVIERKLEDALLKKEYGEQTGLFEEPDTPAVYDHETGDTLDVSPVTSDDDQSDVDPYSVVQNRFYVDVVDLAKIMEYKSPSSSSTRLLINESIRRLYETNFYLTIMNPDSPEALEVMRMFGLKNRVHDFKFIHNLKSEVDMDFVGEDKQGSFESRGLSTSRFADHSRSTDRERANPYNEEELKRIRLWEFTIDNHLFDRLLDPKIRTLYVAHPEIISEPNGLAHSIYNYMSSIIGRKNREMIKQAERQYSRPLKVLHNTLWPSRRYDRFESQVIEILRKHAAQKNIEFDETLSKNQVPAYGFIFTLRRKNKELWLTVDRDRNDPLSGDRSYHNMKLRELARKQA